MDRNKLVSGSRGPKGKVTQQPPEQFIALGAKPSTSREDAKRGISLSKQGSSSHISSSSSKGLPDRKREGSSSSLQSLPPSKKLKVPVRQPSIGGSSILPVDRGTPPSSGAEPWETMAQECDSCDIFETVMNLIQGGNTEKSVSYVLGAIKALKGQREGQRFKPCKVLYNSILLICQCKPSLFTNEYIVSALVSSLRRDIAVGYKSATKGNAYNQILYINTLMHAFAEVLQWPEVFVKLYVEDAVADRIWIDNPYCKPFVENIVTAFNTKQPPKYLLSETWFLSSRDTGSPLTVNTLDDDEAFNEHKSVVEKWQVKVCPRYTQSQEVVEQIVLEAIKEQLSRRQQPETVTKNFVRFLSTACGLVEIRVIAVSRLETWLHNHKLMKPAQELLAYLCYNCSASTQRDIEVVAQLSKLRLKNKPLVNIFNNCLKEMVVSFPENLYPLLKYTIYNELSNARNTNNLVVVGAMFQVTPEASADAFADICLELLLNKDDYLRSLRTLLKEINRVLRHDFNLLSVVHALLRERPELLGVIRDFEFKDRLFVSLADLVSMCMLLCISPQVRDAATQSKRDAIVLQAFQSQVSNIQREAVIWLHDIAVRIFRPNQTDFVHVLHKVLFLAPGEEYYKVDSWPGENERNLFLRLASEVPLLQATLLRLLLIGLSKEHPITQTDLMEVVDQLIKRAAGLPADCMPSLAMDKIEIVDFFFNLCCYNYPENIILPAGYVPPKLAIASLLWKTWLILLILAAHNPSTFGSLSWNKYSTLRMLMEMCITNHFSFPPPTMVSATETLDDFLSKELQICSLERQTILEFESHLAAASTKVEITEQTSLLLSQLIELKPSGDPRKPPPHILDQLQSLNNTYRLGHLLCRSRNPDFLLDIMSRQGGTAHMPWLAELIHSSEGAFAHLPVQCLCEYLLSATPSDKATKHTQVLAHLRTVVNGSDPQSACEVLEYLLRRLTSIHASSRIQAIKGLTLILNPSEDVEINNVNTSNTEWLTRYIPQFLHLHAVKPLLAQFLRQAFFVETNPIHVSNYIAFLSSQDVEESMTDLLELVFDLASLIVERTTVATNILPGDNMQTLKSLITMFCVYLQKARQPTDETFHWSESQDQVVVSWANGDQCTLQILIVHASIILLTYGPLDDFEHFDILVDMWFPLNEEQPKAYLVDTSEEALLVPDWLKLRMIRSTVPRLVDAAVEKLEASQLVLFIQSFGIPVVSISKLLQILDKATLLDPKLVVDSVLDKNYMIQLVEVQNRRGAVGGETFVKALEMQTPALPEDGQIENISHTKPSITVAVVKKELLIDTETVIDSLDLIFGKKSNGNKNEEHLKLLKLIFTKKNVNKNTASVASYLLSKMNDKTCFLASVLKQFLNYYSKSKDEIKMEVDEYKSVIKENKITTNRQVSDKVGERLGKLLLDKETLPEKKGLIVDWLAQIELEIAKPEERSVQMNLLFAKEQIPFRPLLISLLLQRGSWQTLFSLRTQLLKCKQEYCPVSVLNFLKALTQSPKLWQGRDKAVPKHHDTEDVLQLNSQQLAVLTNYILEEAHLYEENWQSNMESRLPLLLQSIGYSASTVARVLLDKVQNDEKARELLLMLYMSVPAVKSHIENFDMQQLAGAAYSKTCGSVVDVISHTLFSALTTTPRVKDWSRKSIDLELCARKLAAVHPELVLRQLPMLAGSLRGRAQYEWIVLKSRGHFLLFTQVLGIVELLQPIVFEQTKALSSFCDSYFLLLQYHGHSKDLTTLLSRFVTFLQNWMMHDVKNALKYLQQHGHLLNDLQISQPSVRPLLSSVTLPATQQQEQSGRGGTQELLVGATTPPTDDPLPQQWPTLMNTLQTQQDPLTALQDLDHISNKRPQLLLLVAPQLYNCVTSPTSCGSTRSLALVLILKLLKHRPDRSSEVMPLLLTCLDNSNPNVISSVLDRLPELVAMMQEHAKVIIGKVFQLSVNENVNASANISKCLALLSLQFGC
ncbi:integrator complex subunit 1 isoform X3 [Agrilus planipennis]|uniref:Integrator complex subunit 1 isoform X3 n=1 Tax=Agrilus planipennis TaxID=224129 RepID=A0A1W4XUH8_AGRPL|nr:integrator complex subunit 1 isoform X4 [Agrilus planipennis]XP_025837490.1 integrator complex subunit 1 isoform X3 [Agrilus planipennis]